MIEVIEELVRSFDGRRPLCALIIGPLPQQAQGVVTLNPDTKKLSNIKREGESGMEGE